MQAEEARAAVRAAEIATHVAMEAQAAATSALAELHAAAAPGFPATGLHRWGGENPMRGPAVVQSIARTPRVEEPEPVEKPEEVFDSEQLTAPDPAAEPIAVAAPELPAVFTQEMIGGQSFNLRWEPDLPARALQMPVPSPRPQAEFLLSAEDWWTPAQVSATLHSEPIQVDVPPPQANLIAFPRELIAARKLRPRLAEAAGVCDREAQLSIFEVDPGAISFEPMAAALPPVSSACSGAIWSGMELDAHPEHEQASRAEAPAKPVHLAPLGLRSMAMVLDLALILGSSSAAAAWMASKITHLPAPRTAEALAILGLLLAGFAYHALFFAFSNMTPGMRYAGIALCTFDDDVPTRAQLRRRLGAMAVSLLPVGLGIVWSVFDDDHLSWHDRISATYLRKRWTRVRADH